MSSVSTVSTTNYSQKTELSYDREARKFQYSHSQECGEDSLQARTILAEKDIIHFNSTDTKVCPSNNDDDNSQPVDTLRSLLSTSKVATKIAALSALHQDHSDYFRNVASSDTYQALSEVLAKAIVPVEFQNSDEADKAIAATKIYFLSRAAYRTIKFLHKSLVDHFKEILVKIHIMLKDTGNYPKTVEIMNNMLNDDAKLDKWAKSAEEHAQVFLEKVLENCTDTSVLIQKVEEDPNFKASLEGNKEVILRRLNISQSNDETQELNEAYDKLLGVLPTDSETY